MLKINVGDPTACMLSIDFNAISAKAYTFLIKFISGFSNLIGEKNTSLYLMPNFIYSVSLSQFYLSNISKSEKKELLVEETNLGNMIEFKNEHWEMALKLPTQHSFQKDDARTLLLRAILVYPRLMLEIANKNEYSKQFLNHPSFVGYQKKTFK